MLGSALALEKPETPPRLFTEVEHTLTLLPGCDSGGIRGCRLSVCGIFLAGLFEVKRSATDQRPELSTGRLYNLEEIHV